MTVFMRGSVSVCLYKGRQIEITCIIFFEESGLSATLMSLNCYLTLIMIKIKKKYVRLRIIDSVLIQYYITWPCAPRQVLLTKNLFLLFANRHLLNNDINILYKDITMPH